MEISKLKKKGIVVETAEGVSSECLLGCVVLCRWFLVLVSWFRMVSIVVFGLASFFSHLFINIF